MKFLIINGPNINLLGKREKDHYGSKTLDQIINDTNKQVAKSVTIDWFQSNSESEIIGKIQSCHNKSYNCLIINPAAFTHSSIAIYDALLTLNEVFITEVHLSNTNSREDFRKNKITTKAADSVIEGFKELLYIIVINSYLLTTKEN